MAKEFSLEEALGPSPAAGKEFSLEEALGGAARKATEPDVNAVPMGTSGVSLSEAEEEPTRAAPKGKSIFERGVKLEPPNVDYEKNLETMRRSGSPESVMFTPGRQLEAVQNQIAAYEKRKGAAAEKAAAMAAERRANLEKQAEQGYQPLDFMQDVGVGLAGKGSLAALQSVAGLGELATGWIPGDEKINPLQLGQWGKMLNKIDEQFGLNFEDGQKFLTGFQSPQMQMQLGDVESTQGFFNRLGKMGVNPLALMDGILTSYPSMLVGGVGAGAVARMWVSKATAEAAQLGLKGAAAQKFINDKVVAVARITGPASEGVMTAGSVADQARAAGVDWEDYVLPALAAGVGTAAIGRGASALGAKFGIGDIETDIAARAAGLKGTGVGVGNPNQGLAKYVFGEMLKEGALEEMPQSAQEQIFTNLATGRPWNEGVPEASATGLMTGAGMGGGHAASSKALKRVGEIIEEKATEYAQTAARKGLPMTPEELARSKGFLRARKTADELAADLDKIGDEEEQTPPPPPTGRIVTPQKTEDQLAVEEEMRQAELDRNAPPVVEDTYEGPEPPDIFGTPATPATKTEAKIQAMSDDELGNLELDHTIYGGDPAEYSLVRAEIERRKAAAKTPVETPAITDPLLDYLGKRDALMAKLDTLIQQGEDLSAEKDKLRDKGIQEGKGGSEYLNEINEVEKQRQANNAEFDETIKQIDALDAERNSTRKETPAAATDQEALQAKKDKARQIAKINFNTAVDQVNSADYNGNLNAALDAYRENTFDTLHEEGFRDDPDWDYILGAADREFDRLVEEHKAKQTPAAPTALDAESVTAKLNEEGTPRTYSSAIEALNQGDEVYAFDIENGKDIFNINPDTAKNLQRLTTPEEIEAAAKARRQIFSLDTEAGNVARADKIMDDVRALETKQQGLLSKSGRMPAKGTKKRAEWDNLTNQIDGLKQQWATATRAPAQEPVPAQAPTPAAPLALTNETKTKDEFGNAATQLEFSDGSKYVIQRLNSAESMGLPGWHDTGATPTTGSFLGNTKEEAVQELVRRQTEAQRTAAPQLPNEPFTIEGETRVIDEVVAPQVAALPAPEVQRLEDHYKLKAGTKEFLARVKEDIVRYANKGAEAVSASIRDIIQKLHAGVLAAAMIFNPTNVSIPEFLVVPKMTVTETRQVFAELPAGVERMSESGQEAYRTLYPVVKDQVQKDNKLFTILDKPTGHTYIFKPDGTLLIRTKTLFGKAYGDFYKGNNTLPQNRITPAGFFTFGLRDALRSADEAKTAGEYDYKKVFVLDKVISGEYSMTIFHSAWLNESDAAMRARALASESETDSKYSFGCVNVNKQTYGYLVNNHLHQMDGSPVFIVPDNPANLASLLSGQPEARDGLERNTFTPPTETVVHESDSTGVAPDQVAQQEADRRRTVFRSIVETATNNATNIPIELADLVKANLAGAQRIIQLYRDGKLSVEDFAAQMLRLQERIERQTEIKRNKTNQRMRGFGRVIKALEDAKKGGRISPETADFAIWFLSKNPALASNLGIKIALPENKKVREENEGTAGFYVPFEELVRLFTNKDAKTGQYTATKSDVAVHEILHHLERMLPDNIRRAIHKEWAKQVTAAMRKAKADNPGVVTDTIRYFEYVLVANATGSSAAYNAAQELLTSGAVPMSNYALFNPSEFWAVRGSGLLAGRYGAKTTFQKVKQWMREFVHAVKSIFGMQNNHPIIRGLEAVLRGDGTFVSNEMLREGAYDVPFKQVTPKTLHADVAAAINRNDITGTLRAIAQNTSGMYSVLAARLAELNLPTNIGFNNEREIVRQTIDNKTAEAQSQLFTFIRRAYPDVYNKYFSAYDKPESLEKVYAGLKELEKGKYDTTPLQMQLEAVRLSFDDAMPGLTRSGLYAPSLDSISLSTKGPFGLTNRVVLHEIVHAATEYMIRNTRLLTHRQREAVAELYTMFNYAKTMLGDKAYGFTDIYEFVAEALTNPTFQKALRGVPYKAAKASVLNAFVRYVLSIFGVRNVASAAMVQANEIFSAERSEGMVHKGLRFAPPKGKKGRYKAGPLTSRWRTAEDAAVRLGTALRKSLTSIPEAGRLGEAFRRVSVYRARMAELPFLGLRMIKDEVQSSIPHIGTAVKTIEDMVAYRGRMLSRAKTTLDKWSEMQRKRPEQSRLMGRVMLEATIQGTEVDPQGPGYVNPMTAKTGEKVAHPNLEAAWKGLDPEFQQLYREVRDYYTSLLKATIHEMKMRVAKSGKSLAEKKKLLRNIDKQFDLTSVNRPYFPLRRFGDYWFQVTANNRTEFYTFESFAERDLAYDKRYAELSKGNAMQKEAAASMRAGNSISQIYSENKDAAGALKDVNKLIDDIADTVTVTQGGQQFTLNKSADEVKREVKGAIDQLVYILLPQQSMKKMFINRRAVQGASSDMMRVFAETATRAAYQQSRFKYVQPFLNNMVNARDYVGKYIRGKRQTVALDYITEVEKRYRNMFGIEDKSDFAKFAAASNQAMFIYNLSAPASALMNVIAFPIMAERTIGGRYGVAKANKVIAKYFGRYMATMPKRTLSPIANRNMAQVTWPSIVEGSQLQGASARAAQKFVDDGDINVSQTNDVFDFAERPSNMYAAGGARVLQAVATPFHQLDRLTREVTLMSVFDLAYEKYLGAEKRDARGVIERDPNGTPLVYTEQEAFDKAIDEARDAAAASLGEYLRQLKGRAFAHPAGALVLQMKQVSMTICYAIFRDMWLAFGAPLTKAEKKEFITYLEDHYKNAPNRDALIARDIKEYEDHKKEIYREAFRKVVLINATAFLMAGAEGTPLYFLTSVLPAIARMFAPDGDEWEDFETWFYNMLMRDFSGAITALAIQGGMGEDTAERLGEKVAHAVARGAPSAITNWSLTERIGINPSEMLFRNSRFYADAKQALHEMVASNLGPMVSFLFDNVPTAYGLIQQGHLERGLEKLLPAGVSKPMVANRLATEGATRVSGKVVLHNDYFDKWDIASQAIGIRPENLTIVERAASQADEMKLRLETRKGKLLDQLWVYHLHGSPAENEARARFYAFAARHPDMIPDPEKAIQDSFDSKYQGLADAALNHGAAIPENMLQEVAPIMYGAKKYVK